MMMFPTTKRKIEKLKSLANLGYGNDEQKKQEFISQLDLAVAAMPNGKMLNQLLDTLLKTVETEVDRALKEKGK